MSRGLFDESVARGMILPSSRVAGKSPSGTEFYVVCNQLAPLNDGVEAFMFKISIAKTPFTIDIYWHDGKKTSYTCESGADIDRIYNKYYPIEADDAETLHLKQGNTKSIVGLYHKIKTSRLGNSTGKKIKAVNNKNINKAGHRDNWNRIGVFGTIIPKLKTMVRELNMLYTVIFDKESEDRQPFRNMSIDHFGTADETITLTSSRTEIIELLTTLTIENTPWTQFELKRLLRMTINSHFQSILLDEPLQSQFPTDDTLTALYCISGVLDKSL